jgi:hypothetical protein
LSDPRDVPATQLLHTIASSLIDQPEFLAIKTTAAEDGVTFTIKTNPGDTGSGSTFAELNQSRRNVTKNTVSNPKTGSMDARLFRCS